MRLHRVAMAAMVADLIAVVSGAFLTSSKVALEPGQAAPGSGPHQATAIAAAVVVLAFCLIGGRVKAAWFGFAALAISGAIAWSAAMGAGAVVWHAVFAHLSIASLTAAVVLTSPAWSEPAKPVSAANALRLAGLATPGAVLIQIALGALYRHQITGIMPHMLGAMLVALLALLVSVTLIQNFSEHRGLKSAATVLITMVLIQVCLGVAVFIMLLLGAGNTAAFAWTATGHVTVGTLTFAASVAMAIEIGRNVKAV